MKEDSLEVRTEKVLNHIDRAIINITIYSNYKIRVVSVLKERIMCDLYDLDQEIRKDTFQVYIDLSNHNRETELIQKLAQFSSKSLETLRSELSAFEGNFKEVTDMVSTKLETLKMKIKKTFKEEEDMRIGRFNFVPFYVFENFGTKVDYFKAMFDALNELYADKIRIRRDLLNSLSSSNSKVVWTFSSIKYDIINMVTCTYQKRLEKWDEVRKVIESDIKVDQSELDAIEEEMNSVWKILCGTFSLIIHLNFSEIDADSLGRMYVRSMALNCLTGFVYDDFRVDDDEISNFRDLIKGSFIDFNHYMYKYIDTDIDFNEYQPDEYLCEKCCKSREYEDLTEEDIKLHRMISVYDTKYIKKCPRCKSLYVMKELDGFKFIYSIAENRWVYL